MSQCAYCRHYIQNDLYPHGVCPAFPGAIPREIRENRFDHRRPHREEKQPVRLNFHPGIPALVIRAIQRHLDQLR
jgi:hypothetical protein